MRELLLLIDRWRNAGKQVALATVVKTYGSSPRPLGAKMAVSSASEMVGSVSGGCVEGAVVQEALAVLAEGQPRQVEYGISDDLAMSVGLACGGAIAVYIEPTDPSAAITATFEQAVREARLIGVATIVLGPGRGNRLLVWPDGRTEGSLGDLALNSMTTARTLSLMHDQSSAAVDFAIGDQPGVIFIDIQPPPPRLLVIGAVHIAIPLATMGKLLGYHTIILDARSAFATPERFGHADQLIARWPADVLPELGIDESTYAVVLTHDEKVDNPALAYLCRSRARYIGALGSRRTHEKRCLALRELGLNDGELARIRAPIGLAIGARRPEEIAVSIMAEIVAAANHALPET